MAGCVSNPPPHCLSKKNTNPIRANLIDCEVWEMAQGALVLTLHAKALSLTSGTTWSSEHCWVSFPQNIDVS